MGAPGLLLLPHNAADAEVDRLQLTCRCKAGNYWHSIGLMALQRHELTLGQGK